MAVKPIVFPVVWVVLFLLVGLSFGYSLLGVFLFYLVTGGWRFARVVIVTLPRDMRYQFKPVI